MKKIIVLIFVALFIASCNNNQRKDGNKSNNEYVDIPSSFVVLPQISPTVNVYIENSGSMDGYVNGNTEFKGAIRDLLVLLKHYYGTEEKIKVHFINSRIRQTDTQIDLATFATNINQIWSVQGENRRSSNLNNIFKMILDKTDKETISILFSDCIYSIQGRDAEGLLSDEKSLTKDAFLSRWRQDSLKLATTIVKMKSKFTGTYWDKDNNPTFLNGNQRPYYITIIGNNDVMLDFNSKIPLEQDRIEGFDNKYVISTGSTDKLYYSVLISTDNVGRFKPSRNQSTREYIHGIEGIDMKTRNRNEGGNNNFAFAVAVDLKNVPAEEDYMLSSENYTFEDKNFRIKDIKPIDKNNINASDWLKISSANPTHLIALEAIGTAISDVKVSLKKQMPKWIEQTNIIDDKDINNNLEKTFGIKYLVEGITEAYQIIYPEDKCFFEFEIKINN